MISRPTARMRVIASLLFLLTVCGLCLTTRATAATPYREMSATEGDPGDGVLRPAIDPRGGDAGGGSQLPGLTETTSTKAPTATWQLPTSSFVLFPVDLPGGATGPGTMIFLPRSWSRVFTQRLVHDGRWHHVP